MTGFVCAGIACAQFGVSLPRIAIEARIGRQELDHTTHRVAAVQRRHWPSHRFDALDIERIDQRHVLVWRVAEKRVVEPESIDQMQYFRPWAVKLR